MTQNPRRRAAPPPTTLLGGIVRLAFFNASGFATIGATRQAFLSSLSPLVAFLFVGTTLGVLARGWRFGATAGLQTLCVVLALPVMSHLAARLFKREQLWLRYATAVNWCQLAIPIVTTLFTMLVLATGVANSLPIAPLAEGIVDAISTYGLLLNIFLVWRGLDLSLWRAVAFLLLVLFATFLLLVIPMAALLGMHQSPPAGLVT